jgi:hypothetical protein
MSLIAEFYKDAKKEWDRLDIPICRIEFAATLDLIEKVIEWRSCEMREQAASGMSGLSARRCAPIASAVRGSELK